METRRLTVVATPQSWVDHAACSGVDLDLFFPESRRRAPEALRICASCRVRTECLEEDLATTRDGTYFGIRGGKTARQRRLLWVARQHNGA